MRPALPGAPPLRAPLAHSTFSSRAAMRSLRWSCRRSLDSLSSRSTVSDNRLLWSSFIFSRWRTCTASPPGTWRPHALSQGPAPGAAHPPHPPSCAPVPFSTLGGGALSGSPAHLLPPLGGFVPGQVLPQLLLPHSLIHRPPWAAAGGQRRPTKPSKALTLASSWFFSSSRPSSCRRCSSTLPCRSSAWGWGDR